MEAIRDVVLSVIEGLQVKKSGAAADDPQGWLKKVLTKKELGHIKFNYFRKGILSLSTDSSGWLYHFSLEKADLLAKLQKESGALKDIRFRIGEMK